MRYTQTAFFPSCLIAYENRKSVLENVHLKKIF